MSVNIVIMSSPVYLQRYYIKRNRCARLCFYVLEGLFHVIFGIIDSRSRYAVCNILINHTLQNTSMPAQEKS